MSTFDFQWIVSHLYTEHESQVGLALSLSQLCTATPWPPVREEMLNLYGRHLLHHCFQAIMDSSLKLSAVLADTYSQCLVTFTDETLQTTVDRLILLGFSLGTVTSHCLCSVWMLLAVDLFNCLESSLRQNNRKINKESKLCGAPSPLWVWDFIQFIADIAKIPFLMFDFFGHLLPSQLICDVCRWISDGCWLAVRC